MRPRVLRSRGLSYQNPPQQNGKALGGVAKLRRDGIFFGVNRVATRGGARGSSRRRTWPGRHPGSGECDSLRRPSVPQGPWRASEREGCRLPSRGAPATTGQRGVSATAPSCAIRRRSCPTARWRPTFRMGRHNDSPAPPAASRCPPLGPAVAPHSGLDHSRQCSPVDASRDETLQSTPLAT